LNLFAGEKFSCRTICNIFEASNGMSTPSVRVNGSIARGELARQKHVFEGKNIGVEFSIAIGEDGIGVRVIDIVA
jgi:hypothetical protein